MLPNVEWTICRNQGKIYKLALALKYDIEDFSNKFLASEWCQRTMDADYSWYQMADAEDCMYYFLKDEELTFKEKEQNISSDIVTWIGFMYRYLVLAMGITSAKAVQNVSFEDMVAWYEGLHTVDPDMAVDIIKENRFM